MHAASVGPAMEPVEPAPADVFTPLPEADALAAGLAERVARRRAEGAYPEGIDDDLAEHLHRVAGRTPSGLPEARAALDRVRGAPFAVPRPAFSSGIPGGTRIHAVVSTTVVRHTTELVGQLEEYARRVEAALAAALDAVAALERRDAERTGHVEALYGQIAELQRRLGPR
jgi:hypothetical protein